MLTIIIVVDSHISRCGVHDFIRICRESCLVARWQQAALFLELSNQLQGHENEIKLNLSREITPVIYKDFKILQVYPLMY